MDQLVCVNDFQKEAAKKLRKNTKDYYFSGADDEFSVNDNLDSYSRILIRPRMLRDVRKRDLSTTILGKKVKVPFGVAPSAMQGMAHPDKESGTAKAVENVGGVMVLSVFATTGYEDIAAVAPTARKWLQFYMHKDRSTTQALIRRAEKAGFEAMVFTVDAQYVGNRRVNRRDPLDFPRYLSFPNDRNDETEKQDLNIYNMHYLLDSAVTWEAVSWLKTVSKLPLVLKGIQTPQDAVRAIEHGADAIWVSNHGGRQLDTAPAPIDILPSILRAVGKRAEVYVDGGIRRGSDIFKALALGANMAFVGRPAVFGLGAHGAPGVKKVLEILRDELDLTMALTGVADVKNITPDYVCRREDMFPKL